MNKQIIIAIVALIVLAGGGYFAVHKSSSKTSNSTNSSSSTSTQNSPNTITFDGSQFSPALIKVKSGTVVTVKNVSSQDLQVDSNPHPVHTDDTDLNVGAVAAGQSATFTATKTGTYGYHDHLDPGIQGKITIE